MIYEFKTEGRNSKDFRDFENLVEFFKNLRDGYVNPKEVLTMKQTLHQI